MRSITAGLLLTKLNTGSRFFTLSELRGRDDDSEFNVRHEITALLNEGLICSAGDRKYKIIVDIYTLRKKILKSGNEMTADRELAKSEACRFGCGDIVDSVWQVKSEVAKPDTSRAEQEEDDEEEINRRRREYLEKRRLELIARMREQSSESDEDDEDDELSEDDDECGLFGDDGEEDDEDDSLFADDEFKMAAHSLFEKSEREMREKVSKLLIAEDRNGKLAIAALKLCASEGYVSPWLLCKTQHVDDSTAKLICFWLYVNGFIKRDGKDENKYLLAMPENLFFACCHEAEKKKSSLGQFASILNDAGEQKQKKGHEGGAEPQKYENDRQFRRLVRAKLVAVICTDLKMTRSKAVIKAEGCLCAARDIGSYKAAAVYEKVIFELNNMSDYMFNRLKSRLVD